MRMKSDLKMPASWRFSAHKHGAHRELERCVEKAMLNLLSECMFGGIMITYNTPDFPLYYIDDRMLSFLDYPNQTDFATAIKGAVINCVRAEDRESLRSEIAQALMSGNSYTTTYRMLCRDKGYIWVKETGVQTVLPNGESVLVSLCLDITGQVEAQAELESIVQCPMGGIFRARMDRDFTLIYANDHYYALHGITRESLRNRLNNGTIHLVHPADIPFIERRLHKAVEQKEQTVSLEYRVVRPDGEVVWLLMNGSLSEQQGNMLLTGMVIDISHQKFMEDRLCCKSRRQRALCARDHDSSN